jgi:hypothetical protein
MFPILVWQHLRELNKHAVDIQNLLVDVSKDLRLMANLAIPETPAVRTVSTAPKPPPPPPPDVESSSQTFQFKCDFCEAIIEYEPEQAGAIAPCPNCGNEINLP